MIIDTQKRVISIQLRRMITLVAVLIWVLVTIFFGKTFLGLDRYHWGLVIGVVYFVIAIGERFLEYTYILYSDETDKIILRYFSLSFISKNKKSIEIPKSEFTSYTLKDSLWGFKKKLILLRYFKNKEAKYPAVSLTILKKKELEHLKLSLDKFCKK